MHATFTGDTTCPHCGATIPEGEGINMADPEADPNVLSMMLTFCSMEHLVAWGKEHGHLAEDYEWEGDA